LEEEEVATVALWNFKNKFAFLFAYENHQVPIPQFKQFFDSSSYSFIFFLEIAFIATSGYGLLFGALQCLQFFVCFHLLLHILDNLFFLWKEYKQILKLNLFETSPAVR